MLIVCGVWCGLIVNSVMQYCMLYAVQCSDAALAISCVCVGVFTLLPTHSSLTCLHTHTHTHTPDCLVRPSFIVKLLNMCTEMNHHEIEVFSVRHTSLQQFPIIRAQLLNHRMAREMHVTEQSHQNTVIEWMKRLEVVYSLGKFGSDRETFFIPYLATHTLSDNALYSWNDAVLEEFNDASVVLFARLSIPATQQFFYRLIASLLTDILQNPSISKCFINLGCTEAMFPLNRLEECSQ